MSRKSSLQEDVALQSKIAYTGQKLRKPTEFERVIDKKLGVNEVGASGHERRSTESINSNGGRILTSHSSTEVDEHFKDNIKLPLSVMKQQSHNQERHLV